MRYALKSNSATKTYESAVKNKKKTFGVESFRFRLPELSLHDDDGNGICLIADIANVFVDRHTKLINCCWQKQLLLLLLLLMTSMLLHCTRNSC